MRVGNKGEQCLGEDVVALEVTWGVSGGSMVDT